MKKVWRVCNLAISLAYQSTENIAAMETTKLRNGLVVVAKSYTNQTQAEKARKKIAFDYGIETYVRARFPFYLVLAEQPK